MPFLTRLFRSPQYLRQVAARPWHLSASCLTKRLSARTHRGLSSDSDSYQSTPWTNEDVETLLRLRREGANIRTIAETLNRSVNSVNDKQWLISKFGPGKLGLLKPVTKTRWTDEEFEKAKNLRNAGASYASIAAVLGRSKGAVEGKFERGGTEATATLNHGFWTPEEDSRLLELRKQGLSMNSIARLMSRSMNAVKGRCHSHRMLEKHDLTGTRVRHLWTKEEDQKLRQLKREGMSYQQIQPFFHNRSISSLRNHSKNEPFTGETRVRHRVAWTAQEVERLRDLREKDVPFGEIAIQLQRTTHSVTTKWVTLFGYKKAYAGRWTEEEVSKLKLLRSEGKTFVEIGTLLNRPNRSCVTKYYNLPDVTITTLRRPSPIAKIASEKRANDEL